MNYVVFQALIAAGAVGAVSGVIGGALTIPKPWSPSLTNAPRSASAIVQKDDQILEMYMPSSSRILEFILYSPDLVYWVGFVTGITCTTHL